MGAIAVLIPLIMQALPAGISLVQFVSNLISQRKRLKEENRPDVNDESIAALDQLIDGLQAKINEEAAKG
jgi:hypothetical protein